MIQPTWFHNFSFHNIKHVKLTCFASTQWHLKSLVITTEPWALSWQSELVIFYWECNYTSSEKCIGVNSVQHWEKINSGRQSFVNPIIMHGSNICLFSLETNFIQTGWRKWNMQCLRWGHLHTPTLSVHLERNSTRHCLPWEVSASLRLQRETICVARNKVFSNGNKLY